MLSIEKNYKVMSNSIIRVGNLNATAVQEKHIEEIREWRNAQITILRQNHIISKDEQIDYFRNCIWPQMNKNYPNEILLSIFQDNIFVAYGGLVHISWEDKRAEVSFVAANEIVSNQEKYIELFSEYLSLIKHFAFNQIFLNRLFTETYDIRPNHIATLEKSGFKREGVMKSHVIINSLETNSLIHGILREDYL